MSIYVKGEGKRFHNSELGKVLMDVLDKHIKANQGKDVMPLIVVGQDEQGTMHLISLQPCFQHTGEVFDVVKIAAAQGLGMFKKGLSISLITDFEV